MQSNPRRAPLPRLPLNSPASGKAPTASESGLAWEQRTARYLQRKGLKVLIQRYRCRLGELDLVCLDGATLVIVEVRARAGSRSARAVESVDVRKQRKIVRATRHLLMTHPQWGDYRLRFDVFCIDNIDRPSPTVRWITDAFDGGGA
ncbi:MAG: YraN family protein [Rhodospirillaceae bacterium]|nr:YraN family protein [Rhodospirillaceae bacterium]MDD9997500.1 YraN family protein [Rhodospirillaceae bacterium]MDE0362123.1 YraN family protein [Rhodospirillaceae bacterium]